MIKSSGQYMYAVNYYEYEEVLCSIEMRYLFHMKMDSKIFSSPLKINPSVSPFIRSRLEIEYVCDQLESVKAFVSKYQMSGKDYDIKYLKLIRGDEYAQTRNTLCKTVAEHIPHVRNFKDPELLFGITYYENKWYFGKLLKNDYVWRTHNNRPYTYSNSLKINLAKVLINIAGEGDTNKTIIDPCCGAGTVLLEGAYAGYAMTGSDISRKTSWNALRNLQHFGYDIPITQKAIEDIDSHYDACIIDLPYGLYSQTSPQAQLSIIENAKRIANRVVIVSSEDIKEMIHKSGLEVIDVCKLIKTVNRDFTRYIWVCES